jgi:hypothetical protein
MLREVLEGGSRLERELDAAVEILRARVGRRRVGRLVHRRELKVEGVANIEEDVAARLGDDNVPGLDGPRGGHDVREDGVRRDDVARARLGKLAEEGVLRRRLEEEVAVLEALELARELGGEAVVVLVLRLEGARPLEVRRDGGRRREVLELQSRRTKGEGGGKEGGVGGWRRGVSGGARGAYRRRCLSLPPALPLLLPPQARRETVD